MVSYTELVEGPLSKDKQKYSQLLGFCPVLEPSFICSTLVYELIEGENVSAVNAAMCLWIFLVAVTSKLLL